MSSKFLSSSAASDIIQLLNDGSQTLNVSEIKDQSLVPNIPVCADSQKKLIGRLITPSDISVTILTSPLTADLDANNFNITNINNLSGSTNSRNADDIVSNTGASVNNNLAAFNGVSGKVIQDSGVTYTDLVTNAGASVAGNFASFTDGTGKVIQDSGIATTDITTLQTKTQNLTGTAGNTDMGGSVTGLTYEQFIEQASIPNFGVGSLIELYAKNDHRLYRKRLAAEFKLLEDSDVNGTFLKLDGTSVMNGNLNMGTVNNITNLNDLSGTGSIIGPTYSRAIDNIVSNLATATAFNLAEFNGATGRVIQDSGVSTTNLVTAAASSTLGNLISSSGSKAVQDSNIIAADVITDTTNTVVGNVITGNGLKTVIDSGTALSSLATTASLANYLPLAGGTMSGNIDMKSNTIIVNNMSNDGINGIKWGNSAVNNGGLSTIVIGDSSTLNASDGTIIGRNSSADNTSTQCSLLGLNNTASSTSPQSVLVGLGNSATTSNGGICVGTSNSVTGQNAMCLGVGLNNSTANSLLIGSAQAVQDLVNIRPQTTGTCDLGISSNRFKDINMSGSIIGPTNSRTADNIVSNATNTVVGNVITGNGGKTITDSGTALSSLATNASLANYLPLAGGTMTGDINLGTHNLTNVNTLLTASGVINIGQTNTPSGASSVLVGVSNTMGGSGGGLSVMYGNNNNASGSANGQSIIYGNANSDSNTSGGCFIFGFGNSNGTGARNIFLGRNNTIPNGVDGSMVCGFNVTNNTSNSVIFGQNANIRSNSDNLCDLGTTTNRFKTLYVGTSVDNTAALNLGTTSATSLSIGRSGVTTTANGDFTTTLPIASWYCTTSYAPTFTANVNRLVPPVTSTSSLLTQFTFSTGVLTYTGTRTRTFRILYNVTINSATNNTNVTFFNSVNGSTTLGSTQSRSTIRATTINVDFGCCLSDLVNLNTNDTLQLAAVCTNTASNINIVFVGATMQGLLN